MQSTVININATTGHRPDLYICLPGLTFPLNLLTMAILGPPWGPVYFRGSINVPCKPICCCATGFHQPLAFIGDDHVDPRDAIV